MGVPKQTLQFRGQTLLSRSLDRALVDSRLPHVFVGRPLAGEQAGLPIHEYPPAEIKKAIVGTGAATKEQVQFMLTRLLRLKSVPSPSDAADGVAAALTYAIGAHVPRLPTTAELRARAARPLSR